MSENPEELDAAGTPYWVIAALEDNTIKATHMPDGMYVRWMHVQDAARFATALYKVAVTCARGEEDLDDELETLLKSEGDEGE